MKCNTRLVFTPITEILATSQSFATLLTNIFSTNIPPLTSVPGFLLKLERTSNLTLYFLAISTLLLCKTLRAAGGKLQHFIIGYFTAEYCILYLSRICRINAVYISVYLTCICFKCRCKRHGACIRTSAAESCYIVVFVNTLKNRQQLQYYVCQALLQRVQTLFF